MATLVQGESSSYVKPKTLKECIILVLQEAGPGGLTVRQMVQRIKEKQWWDWKDDKAGYDSVSEACRAPRNRDVFVHVAPGVYALWALQDDGFTPYVKPAKPMELKEAIILVLQEAGPGGLTVKELVQRIKKKFSWDWKSDKQGYESVTVACRKHPDVFIKHSPGVYALRSLQGGEEEAEGSSKALTKEKAEDDVERTASGAKRAREAAGGSADELNEITVTTTKKKKQVVEEPQSDAVPVEDRRLLLYTNEQREAADEYFQRALEQARAGRSAAGRPKEIGKASSSEKGKSFSDVPANTTLPADCTMPELKTITDAECKRTEILSNKEEKKKGAEESVPEAQSHETSVEDRRLVLYSPEYMEQQAMFLQQALDLLQ